MQKTCAAYIRVSTEDQTEYSPESQKQKLMAFAGQNGFLLPENLIYSDEGLSGRSAESRPGFQALIAAAKCKPCPFSAILVWKFSRFARNQEESIVYKSMLRRQCGVEVISVSEPLPMGEFGSLIERIIEWMDEYYSIRLSGEVRRGMEQRVQQGKAVCAAPIGYVYKDKKLMIEPEEAEAVCMIFSELLGGKSVSNIAEELNQLKIPTKRGGEWEARAVRYVLQNPVYTGRMRWSKTGMKNYRIQDIREQKETLFCGEHEPIIPQTVFSAAQEILRRQENRHSSTANPSCNPPGMLRGLVRCSACGGMLTGTAKMLNCTRYAHGKCRESHAISREKLEEIILTGIEIQLPELQAEIVWSEQYVPREEMLKQQIKRQNQRLQKSRAAYLAGVDTLEEYKAAKNAVENDLAQLHAALQKAERSSIQTEKKKSTRPVIDLLRDPDISAAAKNELLHCFVDHIVLDTRQKVVTIVYRL